MTKQNKIKFAIGVASIGLAVYMLTRKRVLNASGSVDCPAGTTPEECCALNNGLWYNNTCNYGTSGTGTDSGTVSEETTGAGTSTGTTAGGTNETISTGGATSGTGTTGGNTGGTTAEEQCIKSGGIWDGELCNPCNDATHMIYNGVCMLDVQVKCITEQMGNWITDPMGNSRCQCPDKMYMDSFGICRPLQQGQEEIAITQEQLDCENSGGTFDAITGVCTCPTGKTLRNGVCVTPTPTPPPTPPTTPPTTSTPTPTTTTTYIPPVMYNMPMPTSPSDDGGAGGGGGGGGDEEKIEFKKTNEFDWIPYILAGITTALSIVSEEKE